MLGIAAGLGLTVTFVGAFAGALLFHLNAPSARRAVADLGSKLGTDAIKGSIEIRDVARISPRGIDVGEVTLRDVEGRPVVSVYGTHVRFDAVKALTALAKGKTVAIDRAIVDRINVHLVEQPDGAPTIATAVEPRKESAPKEPTPSTLKLALEGIDVRELAVFGSAAQKALDVRAHLAGARVELAPDGTKIDVPRLIVTSAPIEGALPTFTTVEIAARTRIPPNVDPGMLGPIVERADVAIEAGGARAFVTAWSDGRAFTARLDVPSVEPGQLAALTGGATVPAPARVVVDAAGTKQHARATVEVEIGAGHVDVAAVADLSALESRAVPELPRIPLAEAVVRLRGISPRAFVPTAPHLPIESDLLARAVRVEKGTEITVTLTGATATGGRSATVDGEVVATLGDQSVDAVGKVTATYGRAHAAVQFALAQKGRAGTAHADVDARVPSLAELQPLLGQKVGGGVDVIASGDVDLGAQTFKGTAHVDGFGITHPSAALPRVKVDAAVDGPFTAPRFVLSVQAPQIALSPKAKDPQRLHDVDLTLSGTPSAVAVNAKLRTDAAQHVSLVTKLAPTKTGARVTDTALTLHRDVFAAKIAVKEVVLDGSAVRISGMRMASTAGGLRLEALYDPRRHRILVDAASTPLDVAALAHGLALDLGGARGLLTLNAKLATTAAPKKSVAPESSILGLNPDAPDPSIPSKIASGPWVSGHVKLDFEKGFVDGVGDLEAHVDVGVEDRLVQGDVDVAVKDLARVMMRGAAVADGRLDDAKAWQNASGHLDLKIPSVDLSKVSAFLAKQQPKSPPPQLAGTLDLDAHLERPTKDAAPSGWVNVETKGFAVASGATSVSGVDFRLKGTLDADPDRVDGKSPMRLDVVAEAFDLRGPLAIVHAGTSGAWSRFTSGAQAVADFPLLVQVVVPPRAVHDLPKAIAKAVPLDGRLALTAKVEGTVGDPKLDLRAKIEELVVAGAPPHEANVTATYDGKIAKLGAQIASTSDPGRALLALDSEVRVAMADVLGAKGKLPWTAKAKLVLDEFPIDALAPVAEAGVAAKASGEISVDGVNDPAAKSATVDGRIDFKDFHVGDAPFDEAFVGVKVDDKAASGEVALHGKDGSLDLKGKVPLAWADATSPSIAPNGTIEGSLDAKGLRLRVLEPFVTAVDELDGRLDAHVTAAVKKKVDGTWDGAPNGKITVREGLVVVDAVGERWENVTADIGIGKGKIDLRQIVLAGHTGGRAVLTGSADLDGFLPKGFHLSADLKRFGVSSMGARVGELSGTVVIDGAMKPHGDGRKRLDVEVTLDPMTVDLAASAGKDVQPLEDDPTIVVAQPIGPPAASPGEPGSGMPIHVRVKLPEAMWVRRDDLRVAVTGNPHVEVDGVAKVGGEVRIEANPGSQLKQRSWVEVFGKRFYIQQSRVAFAGNEDLDPALDLHVRWQAPDRTIVQIDVTGHLKAPKVTFSAYDENGVKEGKISDAEIMSLLAFGRREAGSAQQQQQAQQSTAQQSAALVQGFTGAIVGRQLQKMLPASMSVSLSPGRYSGGYQHDDIYFEVAYNTGGTRMGPQAIGQTQPRTTFGIEWRFHRAWSLMTTIGDTGSALVDLMWHYRY